MNESTMLPTSIRVETPGELTLRVVGVLLLIAAGFIEIVGLASNDPPPVGSLVFLILGGVFMIYGRLSQMTRLLAEQRSNEETSSRELDLHSHAHANLRRPA